jgi:hypothetical protein
LEKEAFMRVFASILLVAMTACTTAPPAPKTEAAPAPPEPVAAADLVDHAGDSTQTAISVPADAADGGADFENHWIFDRYGRFRRTGGGTGTAEGRRYNVVKIELPSGELKTVYFDITELWERSLHEPEKNE